MLFNNFGYYIILLFFISFILDFIIGEFPIIIHPVVYIGKVIDFFTNLFINSKNRFSGVKLTFSCIILVDFVFIILYYIIFNILTYFDFIYYDLVFILLISLLFANLYSVKLLINSTYDIKLKLMDDLDSARSAMSYLVSRNTKELSVENIISASIETMTENITDSYVSSIFYLFLFGLFGLLFKFSFFDLIMFSVSGSLIFRIINTLDAMVGYKNDKFRFIGWFPAHLDDILNFIPARFTGFIVVISSFFIGLDYKNSFFIFRRDCLKTPSPNSGFTMSAVAGALNVQLEKMNTYVLGDKNKDLDLNDIDLAIKLTRVTILISTIILLFLFLIVDCLI